MTRLLKEINPVAAYKEELVEHYWGYQHSVFPNWQDYFERENTHDYRPPVFLKHQAYNNVLVNPATPQENEKLFHLLPAGERHKWFRSMNSSQALAQSVLGNLAVHGHLASLADLNADDGQLLFGNAKLSSENFTMEHRVKNLGESRPTSLDGFIGGAHQVTIECKFRETEVGVCSRPLLALNASNYATDLCDHSYTHQLERRERCSLTEVGVLYWRYIPKLFKWDGDKDLTPCPVDKRYQLVRNVLAACVRNDGKVCPEEGHAVLLYDRRNPAFQSGGNGLRAFDETREALYNPGLLRKCSWQALIAHMKKGDILPWLTKQLDHKYSLR